MKRIKILFIGLLYLDVATMKVAVFSSARVVDSLYKVMSDGYTSEVEVFHNMRKLEDLLLGMYAKSYEGFRDLSYAFLKRVDARVGQTSYFDRNALYSLVLCLEEYSKKPRANEFINNSMEMLFRCKNNAEFDEALMNIHNMIIYS